VSFAEVSILQVPFWQVVATTIRESVAQGVKNKGNKLNIFLFSFLIFIFFLIYFLLFYF